MSRIQTKVDETIAELQTMVDGAQAQVEVDREGPTQTSDDALHDILSIKVKCARCAGSRQVTDTTGSEERGITWATTCPQCQGLGFLVYTAGTRGYVDYLRIAMNQARLAILRGRLEEMRAEAERLGLA